MPTVRVPTVTKITLGSGSYSTPGGVEYIKVYAIGGGGGGGGSGSTLHGSSGGGASSPAVKFYGPGTYTYSVGGAGGAGGTGGSNGGNGGQTVFDTTLISTGGSGGIGTGNSPLTGGAAGTTSGAMYSLGAQPGGAPGERFAGFGGSNKFSNGGASVSSPSNLFGTNGVSAGGNGGGGGGCIGASQTGGQGAGGALIIIEYY